jgi:YHS domain-containing protein
MPRPLVLRSKPLRRRAALLLAASTLFIAAGAHAAPAINTLKGGFFGGRSDTAIRGYDPVAYFVDGKPVAGQDAYVYEWMGAKWKFASQQHLDLFKADPEKYAPQYGGYCAYGVAQDHLVSVEPERFTIIDGRLYLNYDADVQATWRKDTAGYIRQADAKFRKLLAE